MDEFEEMARYYDSDAHFHIARGAHGHAARSERTAALFRRARSQWELTPERLHILGRPNFACASVAEAMRKKLGREIPRKAEAEQAHVIHWLLTLERDHGEKYIDVAIAALEAP